MLSMIFCKILFIPSSLRVVFFLCTSPHDDRGRITNYEAYCHHNHLNIPEGLSDIDELEIRNILVVIRDFFGKVKVSLSKHSHLSSLLKDFLESLSGCHEEVGTENTHVDQTEKRGREEYGWDDNDKSTDDLTIKGEPVKSRPPVHESVRGKLSGDFFYFKGLNDIFLIKLCLLFTKLIIKGFPVYYWRLCTNFGTLKII